MSKKRHHRALLPAIIIVLLLTLAGGYTYYVVQRPLPVLQPAMTTTQLQSSTGSTSQLTWPTNGQSAVAIVGTKILETQGKQTSVPTASVAKVISALTILQKLPLTDGQNGPTITLIDADVTIYNTYTAMEGSVVPVTAGEQITERQMLEAMMLPSANNMADSLAISTFGSLAAYKTAAMAYLATLNLRDTVVGSDASGFSPGTTSTAHDLAIIGEQAMQNPVLRQIVALPSANDVPGATTIKNVNFLLGTANIIGIKTGNTDQAGGVYLSASTAQVNGRAVTIVTAQVGAPTLFDSLQQSLPLITSAQKNFATDSIVQQRAIIGRYNLPWGGSVAATAQTSLNVTNWRGSKASATVQLRPITTSAHAGQTVGSVSTTGTPFASPTQINLVLQQALTKPSLIWRLLHP